MKGFKSFPERTRLEFSPGVSVIVGPNGSGKSNITDAVLWALGEQSPGAIRGASMQDVISTGGKGIGQRRAAEVEVVIDNSEGRAATELSEIAVQRRLDRSGEGVYRLNGARCRLVDVVEVLSDTNLGREMHSVISQGRVESIIHSKPRERRLLIEEAAGLGKHRKRRRRAELKLGAARDNLDRALDLEREARARLRPLKRQAQAAEIGARIEREELGLRGQLVAEALRFGEDRARAAEAAAEQALAARGAVEAQLAEVSQRRRGAEERFAARDRERTQAWGRLTKLRAEQQRIALRAASLASPRGGAGAGPGGVARRVRPAHPRRRHQRGRPGGAGPQAGRGAGRDRGRPGRRRRGPRHARARQTPRSPSARRRWATVGSGAERAARHARRAEGLLGERHREALRRRVAAGEELLDDVRAAAAAAVAAEAAIRARVERIEATVVGEAGDGDEIAAEMRACSQREYELQAEMKVASDRLTEAQVEAAHLGDRRAEAARELAAIAERLGEEVAAAEQPLGDEERAAIERRLERLERRRAQIGPVNPLAEREYEEAREHVESLQVQREDTERGMRELETLIRDIDREIERAFEQTFEATASQLRGDGRAPLPRRAGAAAQGEPAPAPRRRGGRGGRLGGGGRGGGARRARRRDRGDARRQVDPQALAALGRREVAGRAGLRLRRLPRPPLPLLHPRRGRGGAGRLQHRPLPATGPPLLGPGPVRGRDPPETDDGRRRRALRCQHGRRRRHQGRLPPPAARGRGRGGRRREPAALRRGRRRGGGGEEPPAGLLGEAPAAGRPVPGDAAAAA